MSSTPPAEASAPSGLTPVRAAATLSGHMAADITIRSHEVRADEPAAAGGGDTGPTPVELMLGALASCTVLTVRMYASRKGWPVTGIRVDVDTQKDRGEQARSAVVRVSFEGDIDDAQRKRLLEIAGKCPVHRVLAPGMPIEIVPG